jgi:hypothetical protein
MTWLKVESGSYRSDAGRKNGKTRVMVRALLRIIVLLLNTYLGLFKACDEARTDSYEACLCTFTAPLNIKGMPAFLKLFSSGDHLH